MPGQWRADGNVELSRFARHQDAQAAIVIADDGRIGVSWSSEFLPRYSSFVQFVECAAVWGSVRGWTMVDSVRADPADVVDLLDDGRVLPEASGDFVGWWLGANFSVYHEPRLSEVGGGVANTYVFARDVSARSAIVRALRGRIAGDRPEELIRTALPVGVDFPDPPAGWGALVPAL